LTNSQRPEAHATNPGAYMEWTKEDSIWAIQIILQLLRKIQVKDPELQSQGLQVFSTHLEQILVRLRANDNGRNQNNSQ
jgi:hypothetical protein